MWKRKELLSGLITGGPHLVCHGEIDPKVIVAEADWKWMIERVLQVEIDYRVPPSVV